MDDLQKTGSIRKSYKKYNFLKNGFDVFLINKKKNYIEKRPIYKPLFVKKTVFLSQNTINQHIRTSETKTGSFFKKKDYSTKTAIKFKK
jgi:hypothetical protein